MFKTVKTVDGTSSSSVDSYKVQQGYEYNYSRLLGESVDGSNETGLTESLEENGDLIEGIRRAKEQVTEGELSSYDEVF